jgi:parallel beta-helix repeat protein
LIIPDNTTLIGSGADTIIRARGKKFFDHVIKNEHSDNPSAAGVHNITISHLTLVGQRAVRLNCLQLVASEASRSHNITLAYLTTHHCGRHGIHIKGANNVKLGHIRSYRNGVNVDHDHNIYLLRVTHASVRNIVTHHAAGNGLSSTLLRDATIENIRSQNNGRRGIRLGAGNQIWLKNCLVQANGLELDHQADGIVIVSDDYGNTSADITIQSCQVNNNRDHGIWINAANNIQLINNTVFNNPAGNIVME